VTQTTPVLGEIFSAGVGLAVVNTFAKFKEHNFIHSRNIEEHLKFVAWQVTRMIGLPYAEESMIIC